MHNKQLDTFLKIAELGSFSKAADALFITPSAVIQQINSLENSLEVRLLDRTSRGVSLTPAGELLCREGRKLVAQSELIRRELALLRERESKTIRVEVGLLHQCRAFYDLWNRFTEGDETYRVDIREFQEVPDPKVSDLLEGVFYGRELPADIRFLTLTQVPLVCAVWKEHPLARKSILNYQDMAGQTLVTVDSPHFSDTLHDFHRDAEAHGVKILPVAHYDLSVFSMCAANGYLLQIPQFWQDIHPQLVSVPCDWGYALPYGFFYQGNPSPLTRQFISFVEKLIREPGFSLTL